MCATSCEGAKGAQNMANAAPAKAKAKKAAAPSKDAVEGDLSLALMKEQHALLARHSIAAPPLESAAGVDAGLSAEQLKEAGNQHFRKEQYRQAKRCYAAVLRVQASDVLHSNRGELERAVACRRPRLTRSDRCSGGVSEAGQASQGDCRLPRGAGVSSDRASAMRVC